MSEIASHVLTPSPPAKSSALKRLGKLAASIPAEADLILLGDSLAAGWPPDLLAGAYPATRTLNLGLPGDRVQTTLWRLDRLEAAHLRPGHLLVMVGINNLSDGDPPEAIAAGLATLVEAARRLWRDPETVLVTVPRRGPKPGMREGDRRRLNDLLAQDLARPGIGLLDADAALEQERVEGEGREPDGLHLSRHGYELLAQALSAVMPEPRSGPRSP